MRHLTRTLALLALPLALAACASAAPGSHGPGLAFKLTFDTQDASRISALTTATARVMERRLEGLKQDVKPGDVSISGDTVTVLPSSKDIADELTQQLAEPFSMEIMTESGAAGVDAANPLGTYKETGITTKDFDWVTIGKSSAPGSYTGLLQFTTAGREKLKTLFEQNQGKTIAIFLRGNLMSKKVVGPADAHDSITLDGIPNADIASVFADDVNVGIHVTFTLVK